MDSDISALPIPYLEIARALNFAYRDTRWHHALVPTPQGVVLGEITDCGMRLDIIQANGTTVVMARPTDWTNFHSFSPNACLPKSVSIAAAVDKACLRLAEKDIPTGRLALIGFSQAGYVAMRLGMALVAQHVHRTLSITTFNSAPFEDGFAEAQARVGPITTNYRTVIGGSALNSLGYRVGDYVSILGPLPGTTFEVEIPDGTQALSYAGLHADPFLLADNTETWSLKNISQAAHNNPGLKISKAMQAVWDTSDLSPSDLLVLIGRAMKEDAKAQRGSLDPCIGAQLENLVGFATYKNNSLKWRLIGAAAKAALRHPRTDKIWRMSEVILGHALSSRTRPTRRD